MIQSTVNAPNSASSLAEWKCVACTFLNPASASSCSICLTKARTSPDSRQIPVSSDAKSQVHHDDGNSDGFNTLVRLGLIGDNGSYLENRSSNIPVDSPSERRRQPTSDYGSRGGSVDQRMQLVPEFDEGPWQCSTCLASNFYNNAFCSECKRQREPRRSAKTSQRFSPRDAVRDGPSPQPKPTPSPTGSSDFRQVWWPLIVSVARCSA